MRYETYQLKTKHSLMTFEFISEGPKGSIRKRVQYQRTNDKNLYNLALGDVDIETEGFDDKVVTHNNDTEKVLATVAKTIYAFIDKYPDAIIYVTGNTLTRTRLYRMSISNNLEEINKKFEIYGLLENKGWVIYEKNNNYSAFLIKLKK